LIIARRTFLTLLGAAAADPDVILVFAAMTLKGALDQVVAMYRASGLGPVTISYGPTPTLVR